MNDTRFAENIQSLAMRNYRRNGAIKQKHWWRNMDNEILIYRHTGESNSLKFNHMLTPKERVDRIGEANWVLFYR